LDELDADTGALVLKWRTMYQGEDEHVVSVIRASDGAEVLPPTPVVLR
jgi:hypothetical protein